MNTISRFAWSALALLLIALGAVGAASCAKSTTAAASSTASLCAWGKPFHPDKPYSLGYSLYDATYYTFGFDETAQNAQLAFHLMGNFPYARYMSFVANDETGATVAQLLDQDITPQPGSVNPYQDGVNRAATNRAYSAWLVHAGSARAGQPSTLVIPATAKTAFLVLRVFVPDNGRGFDGGAPPPQIEAVNDASGTPAPCPASHFLPATGVFAPVQGDQNISGPQIDSYHASGPQFGQGDGSNPYGAVILRTDLGQVAVLHWHAPTFPHTTQGGGTFSATDQVRYWSLCLASRATTWVSQCLIDEQVTQDAAGNVTLVMGPQSVAALAQQRGWTFMQWTNDPKPMLLLREVEPSPSFAAHSYAVAPVLDLGNITAQAVVADRATSVLGDYALSGTYCSTAAFSANGCISR